MSDCLAERVHRLDGDHPLLAVLSPHRRDLVRSAAQAAAEATPAVPDAVAAEPSEASAAAAAGPGRGTAAAAQSVAQASTAAASQADGGAAAGTVPAPRAPGDRWRRSTLASSAGSVGREAAAAAAADSGASWSRSHPGSAAAEADAVASWSRSRRGRAAAAADAAAAVDRGSLAEGAAPRLRRGGLGGAADDEMIDPYATSRRGDARGGHGGSAEMVDWYAPGGGRRRRGATAAAELRDLGAAPADDAGVSEAAVGRRRRGAAAAEHPDL